MTTTTEMEDIEFTDDKKKKSICGQCLQFGYIDEHNFGRCEIDAFKDGYLIHRLYLSACGAYKKRKCYPSFFRKGEKAKGGKTQTEMQLEIGAA